MRRFRPWLARLAAGWLLLQAGLLVSVPAVLCMAMSASGIGAECTCDHGDGQMCPMHHTRSKPHAQPSSHSCSCRSTADPYAAMAASLIGPAAVLTTAGPSLEPPLDSAGTLALQREPLESSSDPDSPPPRV